MLRHGDNRIHELPSGTEARLEKAISAFESGDDTPELFDEFIDLINKGFGEANYYVGLMYEDGTNGLEKNAEHAYFYYQKSIEDFGYLEGYLATARMLYHGIGIQQDHAQAFEYYLHVAQQKEHPVACFMAGRMCQRGEGTEKNLGQAREWYSRAIAQGSIYGMLNLAMLEAEQGRFLRSLALRLKAGFQAFLIARKNPSDMRLRGS